MIEIVLGWPPSDLSPNKRLHWAKLAAAKKEYRKNCLSASREQLKKYRGVYENIPERLVLEMTFIRPLRWFCPHTHTTGNSLWHERSRTYPSRHESTKIGMVTQKQTGKTLESLWRMTKASNLFLLIDG